MGVAGRKFSNLAGSTVCKSACTHDNDGENGGEKHDSS